MSDTPELDGATWLNLNRPLLGYDLLAPAWKQYVDALEEQFLDARAALSEPEEPQQP